MNKSAIVIQMIDLYYKKRGGTQCEECIELKKYAQYRLEKCPFKDKNMFCSKCSIHCYQPDKKKQNKKVMRYAGPRMLFYHPILTIRHFIGG